MKLNTEEASERKGGNKKYETINWTVNSKVSLLRVLLCKMFYLLGEICHWPAGGGVPQLELELVRLRCPKVA